MEPVLAGVCTFANGSADCGSGNADAYSPVHVSTICDEMLAQAVKTLDKHPGAHILIVGHRNASERASLAQDRADAVTLKLTKEYDIPGSQIEERTGEPGNRTVEIFVEQ